MANAALVMISQKHKPVQPHNEINEHSIEGLTNKNESRGNTNGHKCSVLSSCNWYKSRKEDKAPSFTVESLEIKC